MLHWNRKAHFNQVHFGTWAAAVAQRFNNWLIIVPSRGWTLPLQAQQKDNDYLAAQIGCLMLHWNRKAHFNQVQFGTWATAVAQRFNNWLIIVPSRVWIQLLLVLQKDNGYLAAQIGCLMFHWNRKALFYQVQFGTWAAAVAQRYNNWLIIEPLRIWILPLQAQQKDNGDIAVQTGC